MSRLARILVIGIAASAASCTILQPQPDRSRFFVLAPMSPPAAPPAGKPLRLGLGPIDFPAYLQRSQMITRIGPNEISLSETERWGEPLDANFARVVAHNLAALVPTDQILFFPWYAEATLSYAVQISVAQFEVDTDGTAHLRAAWKVIDSRTDKTLRAEHSELRQEAADGSADAAVAALSSLVEKLSREIAAALRSR
jgi:uncharacterized lipoprotein YmbA